MLLESDKFDPSGTLPDVSRAVVLPVGIGHASALAGINSGADYAKAIYAAAYKPLESAKTQEKKDPLETDPTAPTVSKAVIERRNMSRMLRRSVGGSGRPDYSAPDYSGAPPLPGSESEPVAGSDDPGNLLLPPPTVWHPPLLLPPPVAARPPEFDPNDLFSPLFPQ